MLAYIVLFGLVVVSIITLIIRSNGAMMFLAVCAGVVLVDTANTGIRVLSGINETVENNNVLYIVALLLPFLLTILITKRQVSKGRLFLNTPSVFLAVALAFLFTLPLLPPQSSKTIRNNEYVQVLEKNKQNLFIAGIVTSLGYIALTNRHPKEKKHHGKHHE
jgi:hypothetical protein